MAEDAVAKAPKPVAEGALAGVDGLLELWQAAQWAMEEAADRGDMQLLQRVASALQEASANWLSNLTRREFLGRLPTGKGGSSCSAPVGQPPPWRQTCVPGG